jgi:hypothetical protein
MEYADFFKKVKRAGEQTATKLISPPLDWFEMSKEKPQPRINIVNSIRKQIRECKDEQTITCLKKELKLANKICNIVIAEAKEHYMSKLAEKIARLARTNSKAAWKALQECELGNKINHKKKKLMSLRLPNGEKAKSDKENMSVFHPHCIRIFNNHRIVSSEALDFVMRRETYQKLDNPITWEEFNSAVTGMKNNKSPGANGVSAEAFKAMDTENLQEVYNIVTAFWDGSNDYPKWHQANRTPVPKIPNPDDPNKYEVVSLMDVCSKILS